MHCLEDLDEGKRKKEGWVWGREKKVVDGERGIKKVWIMGKWI